MSQFLGAALPTNIIARADKRHTDEAWHGNEDLYHPPVMLDQQWEEEPEFASWANPWWPARSCLLGDADGEDLLSPMTRWGERWTVSGATGRLSFVGITRDSYGSPLGGCTVRCFRSSTDELVSKVVSDANGYYVATTPYAEGHYLTIHKTGPPDVSGASIETLIPA